MSEQRRTSSSEVWSVRLAWYENDVPRFTRLGAYFSLQSARTEASKAERKGATVLGIDTGTVEWSEMTPARTPSPEGGQ